MTKPKVKYSFPPEPELSEEYQKRVKDFKKRFKLRALLVLPLVITCLLIAPSPHSHAEIGKGTAEKLQEIESHNIPFEPPVQPPEEPVPHPPIGK